MPRAGEGVHGGPARFKHGWVPVDPQIAASMERIRAKRQLPNLDLAAEIEAQGGFTYNPRTGGLIKVGEAKGFAVAVPGTTEVVGQERVGADHYVRRADFVQSFVRIGKKYHDQISHGAVIGGWYSPETNRYMVELSRILPDRKSAIDAGRAGQQDAVFDLATGETIFTREKVGRGGIKPAPLSTFTSEPTVAELESAKFYTGPGYKPLNGHLRFGTELPPAAQHYMDDLDKLIDRSVITQDAVTYRGVQSGSWLPANLPPGSEITDRGYVSTAEDTSGKYPGKVQMIIHVPKGAHALDLYAHGITHHSNERELLLPRGTKLRVVSDVASASGERTITVEVPS